MRIKRLRFKNINSLAGEHTVDFADGPLAEASIFAIVGPTGSGKSTLLDVITLALYGYVPRLGRVTDTQVSAEGGVVTHHQTEAVAEVTFVVKAETYISSWSIRQARTGKWQAAKMELVKEQTIIASKKKDVPKYNEQIIGLTYEQFIKAIVLSQGQFAAFLQAKKDERAKLLEDITGTAIYRDLGRAVYRRHQEAKAVLKREEQRIEDIVILSQEEVKTLQAEQRQVKKQVAEAEKKVNALKEQKAIKEEVARLTKQWQSAQESYAVCHKKAQEMQPQKAQLAAHDKVAALVEPYQAFQQSRQQVATLDQQLTRIEQTISQNHKKAETLKSRLAELLPGTLSQEHLLNDLEEVVQKSRSIEADMEQLTRQGKEARQALDETLASTRNHHSEVLVKVRDAKEMRDLTTNLLESYDEVQLSQLNEEDISAAVEQRRAALDTLREVKSDLSKISSAQQFIEESSKKLAELDQVLVQQTAQVTKAQQALTACHQQLEDLQKTKLEHTAISSLEDRRAALEEGAPCPLCGSTDHPYKVHDALAVYVQLDKDIATAKHQLKTLETEALALENQRSKTQGNQESVERQKAKLESQLQALQEQVTMQLADHPQWHDLEEEDADQKIADYLQQIKDLTEQLRAVKAYQYLKSCRSRAEKLLQVTNAYTEKKKIRQALIGTASLQDDILPIQRQLSQCAESSHTLQKQKRSIQQDQQQAVNQAQQAEMVAQNLAQKLGFDTLSEAVDQMLPADQATTLRTQVKAIEDELIRLTSEVQTLESNLADKKALDQQPDRPLEEVATALEAHRREYNQHSRSVGALEQRLKTDAENRKRVNDILALIEQQRAVADEWASLNELVGSANGDKFARHAQNLTLRNLIALANARLDTLTDRYLIDMPDGSDYLRVIDRYQGNAPRSVITLSGGETFLLSLALALSLSDMASHSVQLQSLFIDEGFGTLDQDTLEVALVTLERLQAESSKTIGIISHVEGLKERINTQIVLNKSATGVSTLAVVG